MLNPKSILLFSIGILILSSIFSCKPQEDHSESNIIINDTIQIASGLISGSRSMESDVLIFKGIPFAAPPIGDLRWKAPQPISSWSGVKNCNDFGPSPFQNKPEPFSMWSEEFLIPKKPISEDCLHINVWSGAKKNTEKRPVLVWIYGGGFASGGSAAPIYDGEAMAKKGIIFVSFNYRVGIFGFFAHPELTKESPNQTSGNYGLMDQIAALQWVEKNIASFGGDPENITIAGQSAGSVSVNCLVASPLAKGLFNKAIAESGASVLNNGFGTNNLQNAEQAGIKVGEKLNASSIAELRNIPAEDLLKNGQGMRGPIIDGYLLPDAISNIFSQGKENKVALLTGWNENEDLIFGPIKNAVEFRKDAEKYGTDAPTFLKYYPASTEEEAAVSQLNLARDMIFGVQNYTWANIGSEKGQKVFVYRFTRKVPATGKYKKYGAFHTGEVPYAYDNLKFVNRPWEPVDHNLAKVMSSYWVNFIKTGNPNGNDLPEWPEYKIQEKQIMILGKEQESKPIPDKEAIDFLLSKMNEQ